MIIFIILILLSVSSAFSQIDSTIKENPNIFPIWTFHDDSVNIHGFSIGISTLKSDINTHTNGIKIELIGAGLFYPLFPSHPTALDESSFQTIKAGPIAQRINGLNLSMSGTWCHCITNGLLIGAVSQYNFQVNGISGSFITNISQIHNGIQISAINRSFIMNGVQIGFAGNNVHIANGIQIGVMVNSTVIMRGVQVGFLNFADDLKGIQIGVWNVNQDRSFPFFNWSFLKPF
ncbi:MAG: hypothetical protein V4642_05520 [Bacteroidota bacterium]